jgi:hypothetical protein
VTAPRPAVAAIAAFTAAGDQGRLREALTDGLDAASTTTCRHLSGPVFPIPRNRRTE